MNNKPKIKLYDKIFVHAHTMSNGYQKIEPEHFVWYRGNDKCDVSVFTDFSLMEVRECKSKYKIALLMESPAIFPAPYRLINAMNNEFTIVLTFHPSLLKLGQNYKKYYLGGSWIEPKDCSYKYPKYRQTSMIASHKKLTEGHLLRHQIKNDYYCQKYIDIYGTIDEQEISKKLIGLCDHKYSIVIENCRINNYFTEKLIDCFMTGTVPIYWGYPNITEIFPHGIIQFENIQQLKIILNNITRVDFGWKQEVRDNFYIALKFYNTENYLWDNYFRALF